MRGQAMHKDRVRCSLGKELVVYLVSAEDLLARGRLALLAHARPYVGVDGVSAHRGLLDVGEKLDCCTGCGSDFLGLLHDLRLGAITLGSSNPDRAPQTGCCQQQRVRYVVSVANISERDLARVPELFLDR